ncbi:glycosyl transferase [Blastocystis sp. subtype 4]|uniref:glycosyl transferase n=1 Tax=Blastocystis sp. subtype 4 TaxID=944170 RepID=UPI0007115934|nr:glycosyl transferase [Blastocystis sp. subtype 4]KNB46005.1 glycosyl transferase [Blastocystis sp. subtype 4]|eukprot:XP_014529448.1 glycosyl transferase [Blastocystis sp. subtype 4]
MFTANNKTIKVCNNYGILTSNRIERNPYGLPYIGSMYTEAYSMVNSSYYGYINADILVSDRIFDVLSFIESKRTSIFKGSFVVIEVCHNAYNIHTKRFKMNLTQERYASFIQTSLSHSKQRGESSVDMFILSKEFIQYPLGPFVIARARIDTYMLLYCMKAGCSLIDSGKAAVTLHQGMSTYTSRRGLVSSDDYNWNLNRMKSFATLKAARAVLDVNPEGVFTMDRPSNRKIRKKWNVCYNPT